MASGQGSKYVFYGILGFIVVGFVGFKVQTFSGGRSNIGIVGDKPISATQYQSALAQQIKAFEAQIGQPLTFQLAQSIGLDQSVLAQVVSDRALDNEAAGIGLSVGDARVRTQVLAIPAFAGIDGKFDRDTYRETLRRNNLTEAEFEASLRDDTTRSLLQSAVVGGIPDPDVFATAMLGYIGEKRSLTWARIDGTALTTPLPAPTDPELQTYYDANPDAFTLPETRDISYVWLTPDMIADSVTVDDADLQQLYQDRLADFVKPERRLVERLAFLDDAAAAAAKTRLDAGEVDFEGLVTERGLALSDVDLGDVALADLGAAGEPVFAAGIGEVVGPYPSPLGPAFFRMNAVLAAEEVTFEEATPELRAELATARARRMIEDQMDGINDMLAGGATIEDLDDKTDMVAGNISWSESVTDGIAAYDDFRTAAADLQTGAFPTLGTLADGGIFVARLDSVTPPAVQPLADVREAVVAGWTKAATQTAVLAEAARLAAEITGGATFESLALTPTVSPDLTRRDFVENTPPTFMTEAFKMDAGAVTVIDGGDFAIVVRLDATAPADVTTEALVAERAQINEQVSQAIAQDVMEAYATAVQSRTKVTINDTAVAAANAQFQ
jgi:peptidyl-prolyl cis-trans isomerase D